jgi:serine/threonine kinase 32
MLTKYRSAAAAVDGTVPEEHVELDTGTAQTDPYSTTQTDPHSIPTSPDGSPPLSPTMAAAPVRADENFPPLDELKAALPQAPPPHVRPASSSKSFSRPLPPQRPMAAQRQASKSGGVQMVLDESGSWSNLADHTSPMPQDGLQDAGKQEKSSGSMLGFLSRKKGRDRSPKPKEAGVLGKIGARHIMN